jgi:aminomethyltransferase
MGGPGSRRRVEGGFLGAEHILKPDGKFQKVTKKRVGLSGFKAPAREGAEIYDGEGNKVGVVTSGTFSPSLKKPIAMGYVESGLSKPGTEVMLSVRGKMQKAEVARMPFVESRYYRVPE